MNKKLLIAGAALILLLFGGWYFASNKKSGDIMMKEDSKESAMQESSENGSLKDLFMKGVSQTCTFNIENEGYESEGTVYLTNGRMRGDFTYSNEGVTQRSHMIVMDDTSYIWQDDQSQGYKFEFGKEEVESDNSTNAQPNSVDVNQKVDYGCRPGSTGADFNLPGGVEFVSMSEMMQGMQEQMMEGSSEASSQCSVCDSLSGDSKVQCLTALKCN